MTASFSPAPRACSTALAPALPVIARRGFQSPTSLERPHTKGKEKRALEDEDEDGDDEDAQHRVSTHEAYPPMTDGAAETRRVEETLKRWELAERQRRKSIRESTRHTASPSLLTSVTRTASLVLSGRTAPVGASVGPGGTGTFKSHETVDIAREGYAVPLDDIDHTRSSSGDIVVHSPSPSTFDRSTSLDVGTDTGTRTASSSRMSEDPFVHPSERTPSHTPVTPTPKLLPSTPSSPSPFSDARAQHTLHADLTVRVDAESKKHVRKRSSRTGIPFVPPPRPLGLPPPPEDIPHATPLQPTSQPVLRPPRREDPEESQEVRWWHDWLCGCGEGPDRGGDNQVRNFAIRNAIS
ncbi:hypothetical protein J3R82DRAFT_10388 [Butyriboletus roseoflavus]|nr:hypothetical protein J3R82DRAFT_10388 [Butyriboletus roseoflavus]